MSTSNIDKSKKGMLFGYDTDIKGNFYKGEPTTNLVTNGDFSDGKSGWTFTGDSGYTIVGEYVGKSAIFSNGLQHWNQTPGVFYEIISLVTNETYTISFMYFLIGGEIMFDLNNGVDHNIYLTTVGKWLKYSYTFVAVSNSLEIHFYGKIDIPSYYYITEVQVENKPHSTPFVNGSRTVSLIDFISESSVDVSLCSFDSDSKLIFNGIDNYIPLSIDRYIKDFTVCLVFKDNESIQQSSMISVNDFHLFYLTANNGSNGSGIGYCGGGYFGSETEIFLQYVQNEYHFLVSVRRGSTHTIYLDGIDNKITNNISDTHLIYSDFNIGKDYYTNNNYKGELPLLYIYDNVLNEDEISQIFNTIKKRFSI